MELSSSSSALPLGLPHLCLPVLGVALLLAQPAPAAVLTHRYPFNTGANDAVGGADGVLQNGAVVTNGALVLDGSNSGVSLPNNLLTNYDSVSFEVWFVDRSGGPQPALYEFDGTNGEILAGALGRGLYGAGDVSQALNMPVPVPDVTNQLVWCQSAAAHKAALYLNGVLVAQNTNFNLTPASIGATTNNVIGHLGKSLPADGPFYGKIFEFRIFDGALSALEVAQDYAAGPDQPNPLPGPLQEIRLTTPSPIGPGALFTPGLFADYQNLSNVNISCQPGLVLKSDNTNVIAVVSETNRMFPAYYDASGATANLDLLTTTWKLRSVSSGTANVTVGFQGITHTATVSVEIPRDVALVHRYSFSESSGSSTPNWIVHDSVGDAHARAITRGPAVIFSNGQLMHIPTGVTVFVRLPSGIISCLSEVSIEAWLTYQGATEQGTWDDWERIFDFGDQQNGYGKSYFFLTARNDDALPRVAVSTNGMVAEHPVLDWPSRLRLGDTYFVAVTYSPVRGSAKFYINGGPPVTAPATTPLASINDMNNWLGRSQFSGDPYLAADYNEFRIYSGVLGDADVAADYAAGPDVVGMDYRLHCYPSTNSIILTWGASAANWILESSPTLGAGASWRKVNIPSAFENNRFKTVVKLSGNQAFFRLHAP